MMLDPYNDGKDDENNNDSSYNESPLSASLTKTKEEFEINSYLKKIMLEGPKAEVDPLQKQDATQDDAALGAQKLNKILALNNLKFASTFLPIPEALQQELDIHYDKFARDFRKTAVKFQSKSVLPVMQAFLDLEPTEKANLKKYLEDVFKAAEASLAIKIEVLVQVFDAASENFALILHPKVSEEPEEGKEEIIYSPRITTAYDKKRNSRDVIHLASAGLLEPKESMQESQPTSPGKFRCR